MCLGERRKDRTVGRGGCGLVHGIGHHSGWRSEDNFGCLSFSSSDTWVLGTELRSRQVTQVLLPMEPFHWPHLFLQIILYSFRYLHVNYEDVTAILVKLKSGFLRKSLYLDWKTDS